jgi:hypothetical protein
MKYLTTTSPADAVKQAESLGRAYAAKLGIPWPMPPDTYGPGRQPANRAAYYQRYYIAPQPDPSAADPKAAPLVLLVDATVASMDGAQVTLADGSKVLLDSTKAVDITPVKAVQAETLAAPVVKG